MATDTSNFNFQGIGVVTDSAIIGCTDSTAINFDPLANVDDGSCITAIPGCMDTLACNYHAAAGVNQDNGSCEYCSCSNNTGCKSPTACNYDPLADCDDGSCTGLIGCMNSAYDQYNTQGFIATCGDDATYCLDLLGCMSSDASNYDPLATVDDGSCITCVYGCTNPADFNYDSLATCDDGSCIASVYGCTDNNASNTVSGANVDNGTCEYPGCTDPVANNYSFAGSNPAVTNDGDPYLNGTAIDDSSCEYLGCMYGGPQLSNGTWWAASTYSVGLIPTLQACNYDALANVDDGSCIFPDGCTDPLYVEYDASAICDDGSCATLIVSGCMYGGPQLNNQTWWSASVYSTGAMPAAAACNYSASANVDDGSCNYTYGCTNPLACNYNASACYDDSSCVLPNGCTDPLACNYDATATCDDGSCNYGISGCTDPSAVNYDSTAVCDDGSCTITNCTDPTACNYNPLATVDDGSCILPGTLSLGNSSEGIGSPDPVGPCGVLTMAGGTNCANVFAGLGMSVYPFESNANVHGAHITRYNNNCDPATQGVLCDNFISLEYQGFPAGTNARGESYYFILNSLIPGQTYCITWAQIVLQLTSPNACSDCLLGGWDIRMDSGTTMQPPASQIDAATPVYDPVALSDLTEVTNTAYRNNTPSTNDVGNTNGLNTAGAPNGSYSEWEEKCTTFVAPAATTRIHMIAMTDFSQCTSCYSSNHSNGAHGAYVGLSSVRINTACASGCSCANWPPV
jgi:hypothetical protein